MNRFILFVVGLLLMQGAAWAAPLRVVTTTEDLAAIAREVGGPLVEAESLTRGIQDPHFLEARPSLILKASRADLFIQVGLELEAGWVPPLLVAARNPRIRPGGPGFLDASSVIEPIEIQTEPADRGQGDVHPLGNPHYLLDPANGARVAQAIAGKLAELLPERADDIAARKQAFVRSLDEAIVRWRARMQPYAERPVVTYHRSWSYFVRAFGPAVAGYIEPKPGIPPSAAHLNRLIATMKQRNVRLIVIEPYFNRAPADLLARETGARILALPPSVGADGVVTYPELFERLVDQLTGAFGREAGP